MANPRPLGRAVFFGALALLLSTSTSFAETQAKVPSVYIEATQGHNTYSGIFGGIYTRNDLNTVPEMTRELNERAVEDEFPLTITFNKEEADFIWVLGREKKWNSNMFTWLLVERKTGQPFAHGREKLFRNTVKDTIKYLKWGWSLKKAGDEVQGKKFPYQLRFEMPTETLKKGPKNSRECRVFVVGTDKKATLIVLNLTPDIVELTGGVDQTVVRTIGGPSNFATFRVIGTGKKGNYRINAVITDVDGETPIEVSPSPLPLPQSPSSQSVPRELSVGMTPAEVEVVLGKPETVLRLATKVVYKYKDLVIEFVDGRVSDIKY